MSFISDQKRRMQWKPEQQQGPVVGFGRTIPRSLLFGHRIRRRSAGRMLSFPVSVFVSY